MPGAKKPVLSVVEGLSLLVVMLVAAGCRTGAQQVATTYVKGGTIGPQGGTLTVTSADDPVLAGTSIYVPAGALSAPVFITISTSSQAVASASQVAAGPVVDFAPDGTTFASPATITLLATEPAASGLQVAIEAVESNGSARQIAPQSVTNGFATFLTGSFTRYGVILVEEDGGVPDGGVPDAGIICNCPEAPASGTCSQAGPPPCMCPMACDAGSGTTCTSDSDCDSDSFCSSSTCGGTGMCTARPQLCPADCEVPELCGCDGQLYCNACDANAAGTNVAPDSSTCGGQPQDGGIACPCAAIPPGECSVTGPAPCYCPMEVACDGGSATCATNADCTSDSFCSTLACGESGTCEPLPGGCPQDCLYPELCGCNGQPYCNACLANAAGTSVASDSSGCGSSVPDAGVICSCPAGPPGGACSTRGPAPCFCPMACDGGM